MNALHRLISKLPETSKLGTFVEEIMLSMRQAVSYQTLW